MQILKILVFVQSILINLKLCSSKIYLKPDDTFDLENTLDSEFSPVKDGIIVVLRNDNLKPTSLNTKILKVTAIPAFKLAEMDKIKEFDASDLDKAIASDLDSGEIDESDLDTEEIENSDLEIGDLDLNDEQKSMLRKRWRSSCDKKASRTCTVACKNAYKIVCSSYRCRRKMRRDFNKECRRNCRTKFVASYSSIETDTD